MLGIFFFFNDTATTEIYTLSLHDALPIFPAPADGGGGVGAAQHDVLAPFRRQRRRHRGGQAGRPAQRSEEHTSELQSRQYLVCRLLLEKKKKHNDHSQPHLALCCRLSLYH